MGFLRYYLLFSLLLCIIALQVNGSYSTSDSVHASWTSLKTAASSAKIRYLKTTMTVEEEEFSPEQVVEIMNGLESGPGEELISEIIHKMNPTLEERFAKHDQEKQAWSLWDERTLYHDGFSERSIGENDEHLRTRNLHLVHNFKSRMVDCYEMGQCPYFYFGLEWLMAIPSTRAIEGARVKEGGLGELVIDLDQNRQLIVDGENHLPLLDKSVGPGGAVDRLIFFRDQTSFPGGVTLPAVKIQVSFQKGLAKYVLITAILDAEFNVDIDPGKFEMPVSERSVLADRRHGGRRTRNLKNDLANAVDYFVVSEAEPHPTTVPPVVTQSLDWKALILIGNGIFLIVLGLLIWNKAR